MRLRSLTLHGIKPYPGDVQLDLEAIPGRLVAVTGENGAGKTRLMEAWPGAMYRKAPTHGALAPWAAGRDSFVEASFVNGASWTIRQCLDAVSGKGEAQLLDGDGRAVLESTKVREFDGWVSSHLPAPEVFLASLFSAQGTNGLLGLSAVERKSVVLRALGVEHLEAKAERAGRRKALTQAKLDTQRARIEDELARGGDPEAIQDEITRCGQEVADATSELHAARSALDMVRAAIAEHERATKAAQDAAKRRADLQGLLEGATRRRADVAQRIENNRAVLAEADAIRKAEARGAELDREVTRLDAAIAGLVPSLTAKADAIAGIERQLEQLRQRETKSQQSRATIEAALAARAEVEAAAAEVARLEAALAQQKTLIVQVEAELSELQGRTLAGAEARIESLRGGLGKIVDATKLAAAKTAAAETISVDDGVVRDAQAVPALVARTKDRLAEARREAMATENALGASRKLAGGAALLERAETELLQLSEQLAAMADERAALQQGLDKIVTARAAMEADLKGAQKLKGSLADELEQLRPLRAKLDPLSKAETRIAELEPQLAQCDEEIARITKDLGATPEVPVPPSVPPALAPAISLVETHERELTAKQQALAVAQQRASDAAASAGKVEELREELASLESDLADWTKLADDLGKKGVQALLIDAAGPEISEITNDLLSSCFGTRYTVSFETVRLSADGKKEIEDFNIKVLDTEQGRDADGADYSGGQRVILNESLSLAFAVFNCRRNGVTSPTLIRDETGAALSAENSRRYMAMLRRAVDIVGADKLLFVSHNPETWELADNRISLTSDGVAIS